MTSASGGAGGRLGAPALAPLVDELARRYGNGDEPVSISVPNAAPATLRAIADLFAMPRLPRPGSRMRVDRLVAALGLASAAELRAVVASLRGPLPDRRAEREAHRAARLDLWSWLASAAEELPLFPDDARARAWVEAQRLAGARGGVEQHRRRLQHAVAVLRHLPADGISLAVLADRHGDGPHALDRGRSLATVVLDAVALAVGAERPTDAEAVRALWESVGVVPDQLSSTVLALGVPGDDATPLGRWLAAARDAGEPVVLTLASVRRWPRPPLPASACAYVFENPSLIAEAAKARWRGPPLLCSSGRPTVAVVALLRQLAADGAACFQHADFDPAGLAITAWLAERAGTIPWQMTAGAYARGSGAGAGSTIEGDIPATPWDPMLHRALAARRVPVYEESLAEGLLRDALVPGSGGV